jgi:hypothetical protein
MATEPVETPEGDSQQPSGTGGTIPPEAFERIKRENETLKKQLGEAEPVVRDTHLIDTLYEHFKAQTELPVGGERYELARKAAAAVRGAENPTEAADQWLADMSSLFATKSEAPPPPMAAGGNPAAQGEAPATGPFKVGSQEWKDFVGQHGLQSANKAIVDGQFFFSPENEAAQATARGM